MIKLKAKLNRMLSFFTTFVLVTSSLTTDITPITTFAADKTVWDVRQDNPDSSIANGYGSFKIDADTSGIKVDADNL